ncbi:MAG TPA: methyl-accepting chemotaxis protein [Albitalea sp.]|uniref:methyl-accepting chemotaxis protein n=1 Tax=Piscinibacter sp. TaxID=1903157 RepID=UPI002ED2A6CF
MPSSLSHLRIGARLALCFSVVIALILVLTTFTLFQIGQIRQVTAEASGAQAERLSLAQEWRQNIAVNAQRALAVGLSSDMGLVNHFADDVKRVSARTTEIQKRFQELETTPQGIALQDKLAAVRKRYLVQRDTMMKANDAGDVDTAVREAAAFKPLVAEYIGVATEMVEHQQARDQALGRSIESTMSSTRDAMIATAAGCAAVAALLGWLLNRSIVRPLAQAQAIADRIAAGNLGVDLPPAGRDEVGRLMGSLAHMQDALRTLVGHIRRSVDNIGVASSEVATGNQDLSARTEQAAANLQQTASSVEQMAVTVRQSAESASQANQLAVSASQVAGRGGALVGEVVRTMSGINDSSRRIADIIGVIDGIAFQTNILALNAAVEAARAGEQGRGFAVVAGEVRSLAQRSASAAKEIKVLIGDSVGKVEAGAAQVQRAGDTMREIVASVQRVSDIVGEISAAATEQAKGIGEVNKAVVQLDQATQQNAALVEESAAAAQSLKEQAVGLSGAVQRFQLS